MRETSSLPFGTNRLGALFVAWVASWRRVFFFGALALVMVLAKPTWDRDNRALIARQIHVTTWHNLPWFTLLSALISLVLIRIVVVTALNYGLSPWGLPGYTRTVGQVFDVAVTLGFLLKTLFFSLAVAVIPIAASLDAPSQNTDMATSVQPGTVRLFLALVLIEGLSLTVKYV